MNKIEFIDMVNKIAGVMDVKPNEIHIRQMKKKWGSCSSKGRLTFNTNLLDKNNDFIREVIIHELLHLRYEKHDKFFNNILKIYMEKTQSISENKTNNVINTRIESLNRSIDECKNLNYDISPLDQRVNKGNKHRLFVVRRDTVAHGNFEGLGLTQELVEIEEEKYKNQEELIIKLHDLFNTHEPQAFEQYKSASEFIMNVFKKFDSEYEYI